MAEIVSYSGPIDFKAEDNAAYAAGFSVPSIRHPERNMDYFFASKAQMAIGVFDGVGDKKGVDKAAKAAGKAAEKRLESTPFRTPCLIARSAIRQALWAGHAAIVNKPELHIPATGKKPEVHATTTGAVAKFFETEDGKPYAVFGSIGDSRVSLLRDGKIAHLTLDDDMGVLEDGGNDYRQVPTAMLLQEKLANALSLEDLTDEERVAFKHRNIITNTLGDPNHPPEMNVNSVNDIFLLEGDALLVASDGVYDNLTSNEIRDVLVEYDTAQLAVSALVNAARIRSGSEHFRAKPDDITATMLIFKKNV